MRREDSTLMESIDSSVKVHNLEMTQAGLSSSEKVIVTDEKGENREIELAGERPLTLYVDKFEIVTLMTIGTHPELLTLGYLKNQGIIDNIDAIRAVQVDWETEAVAVVTDGTHSDYSDQLSQRTVTTGCGQGTVFGRLIRKGYRYRRKG